MINSLRRSILLLVFCFYIHGFSNSLAVSDCFQFWKRSLLLVRMKLTASMMDGIGNSPVLSIENSIARIRLLNFRYALGSGESEKSFLMIYSRRVSIKLSEKYALASFSSIIMSWFLISRYFAHICS